MILKDYQNTTEEGRLDKGHKPILQVLRLIALLRLKLKSAPEATNISAMRRVMIMSCSRSQVLS